MRDLERTTHEEAQFLHGFRASSCHFTAVEVYLLSMQNGRLKTAIENAQPLAILKAGDVVPPFDGIETDGQKVSVSYSDSSKVYLLFVFSTNCHFCQENLHNWVDISRKVNKSRVVLFGISVQDISDTRAFSERNLFPFTVLAARDTSFLKEYKIDAVPQTILMHQGGIVEGVWRGVLDKTKITEILGDLD